MGKDNRKRHIQSERKKKGGRHIKTNGKRRPTENATSEHGEKDTGQAEKRRGGMEKRREEEGI